MYNTVWLSIKFKKKKLRKSSKITELYEVYKIKIKNEEVVGENDSRYTERTI